MKKITLTMIALVAICTGSFAQSSFVQNSFEQGFGWGIKVGLNVSDMSKLSETDAKAGLTAGVFADYRFNGWFGVSADLLFSREGAKYKLDGETYTMKTNYLNLPILANFFVWRQLAFKIGIQPGVLLSAKDKYKENGEDVSVSSSDNYKGMDFSFPIGLSYEFYNRIVLDARYNIGVANILDKDIDGDNTKSHNNFFTIAVGYRF